MVADGGWKEGSAAETASEAEASSKVKPGNNDLMIFISGGLDEAGAEFLLSVSAASVSIDKDGEA